MLGEIASLATAVGVLAAVVQLLLSRRQARNAFEHLFVDRYWQIDDDLIQAPETQSQYWRRYLRLCEDEFESMRLGQISWRSWEVWHDSIRDREIGTRAALDLADSEQFEWLRLCLDDPRHAGAECWGIFAPSRQDHSKHLSARWKSSLTLRLFFIANAGRRWAYKRHEHRLTRRRDAQSR